MGWGDEVMVTGHVRELQRTDPRRVRIVYEKGRWHEAWDNNPRIAGKNEKGDFQDYVARNQYLRPYMLAKTDDCWKWKRYAPPRGELYFSDKERAFGLARPGLIVIEPNLKGGASPNKDWGRERWAKLVQLMLKRNLLPTQLGPMGTRLVRGAEWVRTDSMRHAAAVIANARAAVLPEGGLHHVAAAVGCRTVVIYGGYISPEVTGYPQQSSLFHAVPEHPLGCGERRPCLHCARAMAQFTPESVLTKLEEALETDRGSLVS